MQFLNILFLPQIIFFACKYPYLLRKPFWLFSLCHSRDKVMMSYWDNSIVKIRPLQRVWFCTLTAREWLRLLENRKREAEPEQDVNLQGTWGWGRRGRPQKVKVARMPNTQNRSRQVSGIITSLYQGLCHWSINVSKWQRNQVTVKTKTVCVCVIWSYNICVYIAKTVIYIYI